MKSENKIKSTINDLDTHGVHMVYACTTEMKRYDIGQWSRVEGMTSGHIQEAWWPYRKHMWMSNRT